jgi:hypothetical protein
MTEAISPGFLPLIGWGLWSQNSERQVRLEILELAAVAINKARIVLNSVE